MAIAEVTLHLEFSDAFDAEDLRTLVDNALVSAKARGALNLPAGENNGTMVECERVGRISPVWLD
jgi:hypothetical protein